MTKAKHPWSPPTPPSGDEYHVWDHFGLGRLMTDRARALSFVAKEDTMKIACLENDGVHNDVTEDLCREWLDQQLTYRSPDQIPPLVKRLVEDWEAIDLAKPEGIFSKPEKVS